MEKGIYCLVLSLGHSVIKVGALGECEFRTGWHIYTGSAQGPGGLSRVARHIRLARCRSGTPRWHIDYLLQDPGCILNYAVCARTARPLECDLARALKGEPIPGFGCSDCHCLSHLFYFNKNPENEIINAMRSLGLGQVIARINTI
jgi:Uri superfamily endonuclease